MIFMNMGRQIIHYIKLQKPVQATSLLNPTTTEGRYSYLQYSAIFNETARDIVVHTSLNICVCFWRICRAKKYTAPRND